MSRFLEHHPVTSRVCNDGVLAPPSGIWHPASEDSYLSSVNCYNGGLGHVQTTIKWMCMVAGHYVRWVSRTQDDHVAFSFEEEGLDSRRPHLYWPAQSFPLTPRMRPATTSHLDRHFTCESLRFPKSSTPQWYTALSRQYTFQEPSWAVVRSSHIEEYYLHLESDTLATQNVFSSDSMPHNEWPACHSPQHRAIYSVMPWM
ncbi:hypothetical protein BKA65DRAFT_541169 [Rhexocercosporidium sp. MPI-PUGE-AT-0058]|nr:hypothetical protein BKA65DRAFT_541169 [Rhexocercosporidium sp. MPI-PUGE-AT-0058]